MLGLDCLAVNFRKKLCLQIPQVWNGICPPAFSFVPCHLFQVATCKNQARWENPCRSFPWKTRKSCRAVVRNSPTQLQEHDLYPIYALNILKATDNQNESEAINTGQAFCINIAIVDQPNPYFAFLLYFSWRLSSTQRHWSTDTWRESKKLLCLGEIAQNQNNRKAQ